MLYLETGCLPLSHIITVRRLMCLHTKLQGPETEIIRKVFTEQKRNPCKGDWVTLVEADMFGIEGSCEDMFRKHVVKKVTDIAFSELRGIQAGHEKV